MISGLKTLSSKLPEAPPMLDRGVVAEHLGRRPSSALRDWVGFTLPGMIELPGSFSGDRDLAEPGARAGREPADVVARSSSGATASVFSAPWADDQRVVRRERLELVRRRDERQARQLRDPFAAPRRRSRAAR